VAPNHRPHGGHARRGGQDHPAHAGLLNKDSFTVVPHLIEILLGAKIGSYPGALA
jgi:hypothetical protein